jgi:hypothetical protein
MTKEQKKLLSRAAAHVVAICDLVVKCNDDDLRTLNEACTAASTTNCGWATFKAAQLLQAECRAEIATRSRIMPSKMAPHLTEHGRRNPSSLETNQ